MTQKNNFKFDFEYGDKIAKKYMIIKKLGGGWEGEVYKAEEMASKITCALKFFYPKRNIKNRVANKYAHRLHQLSESPVAINYYTQEFIQFKGHSITCFVYEYADGTILSDFLKRQPGRRVGIMEGLLLLHSLTKGIENVHFYNEYHGDLHTDNIIIKRKGLGFEFKLLDMYNWGDAKSLNKAEDIVNLIRIFYEAIGGRKHYAKHPAEVKDICLGLKSSLIHKKFRTASLLRQHIENIEWQTETRL
jgi:serine/threonine protein kinase